LLIDKLFADGMVVILYTAPLCAALRKGYSHTFYKMLIFVLMSRALLSISMLCLVILSSGLTLNVHFCMNQVEDVSLFATDEHQCGTCGMKQQESGGCCHQEKQLVKLIQDQCPPHFIHYTIASASAFALPEQTIIGLINEKSLGSATDHFYHPPDFSSPPLFLRNRVFRI
jgi:hypothetical protein